MPPARTLFPYWGDVHRDMQRVFAILPPDRLSFRPHPALMTLGQLAVHIAAAEDYWAKVIRSGGTGVVYAEPKELLPLDEVKRRYEAAHGETERILDDYDVGQLEAVKMTTPRGRTYDGRWMLNRVYEHAIHHKAQLLLSLRLAGIDPATRIQKGA